MTAVISDSMISSYQLKQAWTLFGKVFHIMVKIFLCFRISATEGQEREREVENPLLLLGAGLSSWMRHWDRGNPLPPHFSLLLSKRTNRGQVQQWRNRRRKQRQDICMASKVQEDWGRLKLIRENIQFQEKINAQ